MKDIASGTGSCQGRALGEPATSEDAPFPSHVAAVLADADRAALALAGGSHHRLYQLLRQSAGRVAPVDAFYVGFYREGRRVAFPYSFDGREYDDPSEIPYGEGGLSAWMLANRRPYWSREDNGRLLGMGQNFGDTDRVSSDVIVVPVFDRPVPDSPLNQPDGPARVLGMMSMQSYAPGSYDDVTIRAFAWLAGTLATVLAREREDGRRRSALGAPAGAALPSVAYQVAARLGSLRRGVDALAPLVPVDHPALSDAVASLRDECERTQTEVAELLAGEAPDHREDPLAGLTARQREVAGLLAQGLDAREIGARLFISAHTVRDHRRAIRGWLGVSGRSEVAERLRRAISPAG